MLSLVRQWKLRLLTAVNFQFCEVSESVGCLKTGLDVLVGHVGLLWPVVAAQLLYFVLCI